MVNFEYPETTLTLFYLLGHFSFSTTSVSLDPLCYWTRLTINQLNGANSIEWAMRGSNRDWRTWGQSSHCCHITRRGRTWPGTVWGEIKPMLVCMDGHNLNQAKVWVSGHQLTYAVIRSAILVNPIFGIWKYFQTCPADSQFSFP